MTNARMWLVGGISSAIYLASALFLSAANTERSDFLTGEIWARMAVFLMRRKNEEPPRPRVNSVRQILQV